MSGPSTESRVVALIESLPPCWDAQLDHLKKVRDRLPPVSAINPNRVYPFSLPRKNLNVAQNTTASPAHERFVSSTFVSPQLVSELRSLDASAKKYEAREPPSTV